MTCSTFVWHLLQLSRQRSRRRVRLNKNASKSVTCNTEWTVATTTTKQKGTPKKEATSSAAAAAVKSLAMQFLAGKIGTTRKTRREGEEERERRNRCQMSLVRIGTNWMGALGWVLGLRLCAICAWLCLINWNLQNVQLKGHKNYLNL